MLYAMRIKISSYIFGYYQILLRTKASKKEHVNYTISVF